VSVRPSVTLFDRSSGVQGFAADCRAGMQEISIDSGGRRDLAAMAPQLHRAAARRSAANAGSSSVLLTAELTTLNNTDLLYSWTFNWSR